MVLLLTGNYLRQYFSEKWLVVSLGSNSLEINEEYYIYDIISIISNIGGGLGLFLGISFLSVAYVVLDFAYKMIKPLKQ